MKLKQIKVISILMLGLLFSGTWLSAQTTVSGVIIDANTRESLIGATVVVKNSTNGTSTGIDGDFSLQVESLNDTLIVSYLGYESEEIAVNGSDNLVIEMIPVDQQLEEVIVVGYGTQKKREVIGSTARIKSSEIQQTPILRTEQALQGRTAGVQVTSLSGQPGEEPTVRIRGTGTTGDSRPLYIVDGMPVSGIDYLNPGDIESIDVLKDAAAAAIYGARAANGVVLITTKLGSDGKMNVSYDAYYGIQSVINKVDMLNADQYRNLMNEGARNGGLTEPFDLQEVAPHNTNWQNEVFQNAPMTNHQISVNGGNKKAQYGSSLSFFDQEGIIGGPKSKFNRYTGRFNSKVQVNEVFSFGNNLAFTHLRRTGIESNQSFNGVYSSALNMDPLTPVYETDPDKLSQYPYNTEPVVSDENGIYGISEYVGGEVVNPLGLLAIDTDETRKDQIVGSVWGEVEPVQNLKFRSRVGVDMAYVNVDGYRPLFFLNGAQLNDSQTSVFKSVDRYFTWQWENILSYSKDFGDHSLSGLLGTTAFEFKYENLYGFNTDVPIIDPDNVYLNQATDTLWDARGGASHAALFSVFGRANYTFKNRYTVTAVLRRDGSSKFGANNRYGWFPSIGVAWVISDEQFFNNSIFDVLKARASWGVNGNQEIGDYQFVSIIDNTRRYDYGAGSEVGASPLFVENQDLRWEESEQYNFGLDFGLVNNKLQGTLDLYVKNTNGLLERLTIPAHVGNEPPFANVGSVRNQGVEFMLSWRDYEGPINYNISGNIAYNKNTMTFIGNDEKVIPGASWAISGPVTRSEEGLPMAFFWGYQTDGIFQNQAEVFQHINSDGELLQPKAEPGDVKFVDFNNDGVLNDNDKTMIGNPIPEWTYGTNFSLGYKGFELSAFFQGVFGNEIFNGTQRRDLRYTNRTADILDRWTGEGTSDSQPRYTWVDVNNNNRISDLYIESGSFVRIKNVQLGYSLSQAVLDRIGAQKVRVYVSGDNLFTITNYSGVDPEIGALSSFDIGIDRAVYPPARIFRAGINVTF